MNEIRFIDLFSGIGGFRLGFERANKVSQYSELWIGDKERRPSQHLEGRGISERSSSISYKCVWSCDWNKYANEVYTRHFGEENHHSGDIKRVNTKDIPDFDLLCSGFPCQAFSMAGKRKGFRDTRGTLFFEICRIAEAKRPDWLLLENVRGLLSHNEGLTFQIILESLEELGYWIEWQVLNSKYFGVPQNRERVFIIGHSRGTSSKPIFPITENGEVSHSSEEQKTAGSLTGGGHSGGLHSDMTILGMTLANTSRYNQGYNRTPAQSEGISWALNAAGDQGVAILADRTRTLAGKGRNLESPKPITNALSSVNKDNPLLKNTKIRRLTPIECERLQGFPDGWTEGISDTQRYRVLGNAVTVNVTDFLGKLLMSYITNKDGTQ